MSARSDLDDIKADLQRRLPLTEEQLARFHELHDLARSVATNLLKRWSRHRWLMKEDLYAEADVHLADAIRNYDPDKSPSIRGWSARWVRWRLSDWLNAEYRAHDYVSLTARRERESDGMTSGRWDHIGSYTHHPIHWLIAAEIATAVRHCFDPRNVEIYLDRWHGNTANDVAYKHGLRKSRIYEIAAEVREYIARQIEGTGVKPGQVIGCLQENKDDCRKATMRLLNYEPEEISGNFEKSTGINRLFPDYKYRDREEPKRDVI